MLLEIKLLEETLMLTVERKKTPWAKSRIPIPPISNPKRRRKKAKHATTTMIATLTTSTPAMLTISYRHLKVIPKAPAHRILMVPMRKTTNGTVMMIALLEFAMVSVIFARHQGTTMN